MQNGTNTWRPGLEVSYKANNTLIIQSCNATCRYLPKFNENLCSHKNYTNVHSSVIHNCQKLEITQMHLLWRMENKLWYTHMLEDYSAIKRDKLFFRYKNKYESQMHQANRKKPDSKEHTLNDSIYRTFLQKGDRSVVPSGVGLTTQEHRTRGGRWPNCSLSWLSWWKHNCTHMSKPGKLYTEKDEF